MSRHLFLLIFAVSFSAHAASVRVGSKNFNESYILAEVLSQLLEANGYDVERKFGLGGTLICYEALRNGEIDIYVEYTGTISQAILKQSGNPSLQALNQSLSSQGLTLLPPLGFNNTYAVVVRASQAQELGLSRIGDLAQHPDLRLFFSHEFVERGDGWPGLQQAYQLPHTVNGIEHGLAYQAMGDGAIDVTDAYSTDGELERYALTILQDDAQYFPSYYAAPLVRLDLSPSVRSLLSSLQNSISDQQMQSMNADVVFGGQSFAQVAATFLQSQGIEVAAQSSSMWTDLIKNTLRHLQLTGIALSLAIVVGLGASLLVYRHQRLSDALIYLCGLLQTIPSIALLALMIPLFGIGIVPAIVALFLYSLLPILRNAVTALVNVEPLLIKVSTALGLNHAEQLRHVLLPLSLPAIFAGIKTAAVISIGTATLAAFIGAGGLGDPIVVGLALDNVDLILQGAIPAAVLAIFTELLFSLIERRLTP